MAKDEARPGSWVIVVGEPGSEWVQAVVRLAREREIGALPCANVYEAVVAMAQAAGRRLLVVGRMRDLAAENGVFLRISTARAARCCCLLEADRTAEPQDLLAATRANATVVGAAREVLAILQDWSATAEPPVAPPAPRPLREGSCEDLRATEAELRALLE